MPIAATLQAPTWVSSGAVITGGLDLLGLRLPVQLIGGTLLDGVATVPPSVRYLAFRAWLIHRYGQSGQPDRWQDFTNFAARIESALVLGNLTQDRSIGGLIGTDQALARLDANTPRVAISALVNRHHEIAGRRRSWAGRRARCAPGHGARSDPGSDSSH